MRNERQSKPKRRETHPQLNVDGSETRETEAEVVQQLIDGALDVKGGQLMAATEIGFKALGIDVGIKNGMLEVSANDGENNEGSNHEALKAECLAVANAKSAGMALAS